MPESINHPPHYNAGNIEVIDAIEDWKLGFHLGNTVKYIARADHKGKPLEDLLKAQWYLAREIQRRGGNSLLRFFELCEELRSEQGESITLLCDNEEGPNAVIAQARWTQWKEVRYEGRDLFDALEAAIAAKKAALAGKEVRA